MQWAYEAFCEQGYVRNYNEDGYLALNESAIYAVADGMGGMQGGAEASKMVLDLLQREYAQPNPLNLRDIICKINREATEYGHAHFTGGFGTTLTVLQLTESNAMVGHVGDSAAFRIRDGKVEPLTEEHTTATMLAKEKQIPLDKIPELYHHSLTLCMGQEKEIEPDAFPEPLKAGDQFLLCSDGVTKLLDEKQLERLYHKNNSPEDFLDAIKDQVYAQGAPDNLTALLVYERS